MMDEDTARLHRTMSTLKRVMGNVASDNFDGKYRRLLRNSSVYKSCLEGEAEDWLIGRQWNVEEDGAVLVWRGTPERAREAILELLGGVSGGAGVAVVEVVPEVKERVRNTILELTTKGLWFFKCCFKFSAADFARGGSYLNDANVAVEDVEAALAQLIDKGELEALVPGKLFYALKPGMSVRRHFCYAYE